MPRPEDRPVRAKNRLVRQIFERAQQKRLSFEYLTEVTGIMHGQLSGYRTGKNVPSADRLVKLASAVGYVIVLVDPTEDRT